MELPDIGRDSSMRCVARATSISEAEEIAKRYESEGFRVEIRRKTQNLITIYEIWAGRNPDAFSGRKIS